MVTVVSHFSEHIWLKVVDFSPLSFGKANLANLEIKSQNLD
jgi:hypothetical protein